MSDEEVDDANSEQPLSDALNMFGSILLLQTIPILRKAGHRMLSGSFVTKVSVDAARPEQRHIS